VNVLQRVLLLLAWLVTARAGDAQTLRIVNATVVDVATGQLHRGSTIVIHGNRITSVGAAPMAAAGRIADARVPTRSRACGTCTPSCA